MSIETKQEEPKWWLVTTNEQHHRYYRIYGPTEEDAKKQALSADLEPYDTNEDWIVPVIESCELDTDQTDSAQVREDKIEAAQEHFEEMQQEGATGPKEV